MMDTRLEPRASEFCVQVMVVVSDAMGISYQALNILLFVILHLALTLYLWIRNRQLKRQLKAVEQAV